MSFAEPTTPLLPGVRITLPDPTRSVQCPQISIKQRRDNRTLFMELAALRSKASELAKDEKSTFETVQELQDQVIDTSMKVLKLAFERNYPQVTEDDFDFLSSTELNELLGYALNRVRPEGEAKAPVVSRMDEVSPIPNGARPISIGMRS